MLSILFFAVSFGIVLGQFNLYKDAVKAEKFSKFISNKNNLVGTIDNVKYKNNSQEILLQINNEMQDKFHIKIITGNIPLYSFG